MSNESPRSGDRRPVKSRSWKSSQWMANWLAARSVSPNAISVAGMVAGLVGGIALAFTGKDPNLGFWLWLLAAVCIQLRLQANLLDGMVAIQSGKASRVGELFNEVPDRISDTALLVGAGLADASNRMLGMWAALAAMMTAYIRTTGKSAGAPMEFCGPMAKQHRMAVLTVVCLTRCFGVSRIPTGNDRAIEIVVIGLLVIVIGSLITSVRRLQRIAAYLRVQPE